MLPATRLKSNSMTRYDEQYQVEENLFGLPYAEFEAFVKKHARQGGKALDLGCGQGRDALMLAEYGYTVTGVDVSRVGVAQMLERANARGLPVRGVVADFYEYELPENFDAIVLDSILHFEKADRTKELALLDTVASHLRENGYLFLFVHQSRKKERALKAWLEGVETGFELVEEGYIDYVYHEKATGFQSAFQFYMLILKRVPSA
jgi:cyclopropane fatty-acyl-phospholipid synthase-like methyltransferase